MGERNGPEAWDSATEFPSLPVAAFRFGQEERESVCDLSLRALAVRGHSGGSSGSLGGRFHRNREPSVPKGGFCRKSAGEIRLRPEKGIHLGNGRWR